MLALTIPKQVCIINPGLSGVYCCLMFTVLVLSFTNFWVTKQFTVSLAATSHTQVSFADNTVTNVIRAGTLAPAYCNSTASNANMTKFNHTWLIKSRQCKPVCDFSLLPPATSYGIFIGHHMMLDENGEPKELSPPNFPPGGEHHDIEGEPHGQGEGDDRNDGDSVNEGDSTSNGDIGINDRGGPASGRKKQRGNLRRLQEKKKRPPGGDHGWQDEDDYPHDWDEAFSMVMDNMCVSPFELLTNQNSGMAVLMTGKQIYSWGPDMDGGNVSRIVYPTAKEAIFEFQCSYQLEQRPPIFPAVQRAYQKGATYQHDASQQAYPRVFLLGRNGLPLMEFAPKSIVKLTSRQLVAVALGMPSTDNEGQPVDLSSQSLPVHLMFNGAEFASKTTCYNDDYDLRSLAEDGGDLEVWKLGATIEVPVCLLQISFVRWGAVVRDKSTNMGDMGAEYEIHVGIAVIGQLGKTSMRFPDLNAILLSLTSMFVLMALPVKGVRLLALYGLGHLSRIYHRALVEPFDVKADTAAAAMQLVINSVPFVDLADAQNPEMPGAAAISKGRILERLQETLRGRHETLDDRELHSLVNFCFQQSLKRQYNSNDKTRLDVIDQDTYATSCLWRGGIDFDAVVNLFDVDRRVWFMEWLFTPRSLWRSIRGVHKKQHTESALPHDALQLTPTPRHVAVTVEELDKHPLTRPSWSLTPNTFDTPTSAFDEHYRVSLEDEKKQHRKNQYDVYRLLEHKRLVEQEVCRLDEGQEKTSEAVLEMSNLHQDIQKDVGGLLQRVRMLEADLAQVCTQKGEVQPAPTDVTQPRGLALEEDERDQLLARVERAEARAAHAEELAEKMAWQMEFAIDAFKDRIDELAMVS